MKIIRSKRKVDPYTQREGVLILDDCHTYNSHFWRFKSNVFHGDMIRSNHILKHNGKIEEDNDILDDDCTLIHSENEWTNVTRTTRRKNSRKHPMNLKTLPVEKKIQPVPHSLVTNNLNMDVMKIDPAKH